jgi:hypothetical protein
MKSISHLSLSLLLLAALGRPALACDSCALFVAEGGNHGFTASVASQFTRFGTVWSGSARQHNPVAQYLNSSITQLTLGYDRGGRWQAQATLPSIRRTYLRPDHALIEQGRVSGIGDATLAVRYLALDREVANHAFSLGLLGGIEFGTGNADHLGDEVGAHFHHHANFPDSGIHGHDLALGSGSTDYVLGADAAWRNGRNFVRGALQYKLRRPGSFGYRLADETSWDISAGRYLVLADTHTFSAQALASAEHKGFDQLGGLGQVDTGFNARYAGARLTATVGLRFKADASFELPVRIRTTELLVVPDYRLRAACTWQL